MKNEHKEILKNWVAPAHWQTIRTIDMHTEGEPLRIFVDGFPEIRGNTILEKMKYFKEHYDHLRTGMMFEPRGHADMYGAILTEPVTPDGDFGVFFLHNEGYSTMCGHAIIAITKLVLESGMLERTSAHPILQIDAPPGRIVSSAIIQNDKVQRVSFLNVPSFLYLQDQEVVVPELGRIKFDIAFGGAFYAFTDAASLGLDLHPSNYNRLIDFGKKIKKAVMENFDIIHPYEEGLSFLYGTIFTGRADKQENHSRNVCIFAEGEVDRSPTGSGVSARAALHYAKGEIEKGKSYTVESILGTTMDMKVVKATMYGPLQAVIPQVSGNAFVTGSHKFHFDNEDPLRKGFIFR